MDSLWFWGLCGAFAYAAPALTLKLKENHIAWRLPMADFVIAMALGPIFSRTIGPAIAYYFPWTAKPDMVALAFMIGLCANQAAPMISKAVSKAAAGWVIRRAKIEDASQ